MVLLVVTQHQPCPMLKVCQGAHAIIDMCRCAFLELQAAEWHLQLTCGFCGSTPMAGSKPRPLRGQLAGRLPQPQPTPTLQFGSMQQRQLLSSPHDPSFTPAWRQVCCNQQQPIELPFILRICIVLSIRIALPSSTLELALSMSDMADGQL